VVQALSQAGENPFGPSWSVVLSGTVRNAADAALSQQGENGCWPNLFGPGDDPFGTTDAILLMVQEIPWGAPVVELAPEPEPADVAESESATAAVETTDTPAATDPPEATSTVLEPSPTVLASAEADEQSVGTGVNDENAETAAVEPSEPVESAPPAIAWALIVLGLMAVFGVWLLARRSG